jgi:AcrR family transcriptional regulator
LRAALDSFSEAGFGGAKTRDIAARAGVTLGLLQYHYGSKAKLWRAAVDRAFVDLERGLDEATAGAGAGNLREQLRRLIRAQVRFVGANPEFVRLMHEEGKRRGERMRWLVDRHAKPLFDKLLPLMAQAQQQGLLPNGVAPIHFAYTLLGAIDLIFHQAEECKRLSGIDPTDSKEIEAHARAVEHLFLGPPPEESH